MTRRPRTISALLLVSIISLLLSHLHAGTDSVTLTDGTTLQGKLQGVQADFLLLQVSTNGDGSAIRRIHPQEVARIHFSDTLPSDGSPEEMASASASLSSNIESLEKLTRNRSSYFGLLQPEDEALFLSLIDAYIKDDRALEALAYAKLWQNRIRDDGITLRLRERLIEAALAAGLSDEAFVFATDWRRDYPDHPYSALATHVVAEAALERNEPETAAWVAIKPIAAQCNPSPRYLDRCYDTAITALKALADHAYASRLHHEKNLLFASSRSSLPYGSSSSEPEDTPQPLSLPSLAADTLTFDKILKTR